MMRSRDDEKNQKTTQTVTADLLYMLIYLLFNLFDENIAQSKLEDILSHC